MSKKLLILVVVLALALFSYSASATISFAPFTYVNNASSGVAYPDGIYWSLGFGGWHYVTQSGNGFVYACNDAFTSCSGTSINRDIYPQGLTYNGTYWFVVSSNKDLVISYNSGWGYVSNFSVSPLHTNPSDITFNGTHLFVSGGDNSNISVYTTSGTYVKSFNTSGPPNVNGLTWYANNKTFYATVPNFIVVYNSSFVQEYNWSTTDRFPSAIQGLGIARNELRAIIWNGGTKDSLNFTLPYKIISADVTPPAITIVTIANTTNQTAGINITTSSNANRTVNYGVTTSLGTLAYNGSVYTTFQRINISGLLNNTDYYFNVTACDSSNNCNSTGGFTFRTQNNTNGYIPKIYNHTIISLGNDTVLINITTDHATNKTVSYGTTTALGSSSSNTTYALYGVVTLSGLTNNTLYNYNVSSYDQFGFYNNTGKFTFTTAQNTEPIISGSCTANASIYYINNQSSGRKYIDGIYWDGSYWYITSQSSVKVEKYSPAMSYIGAASATLSDLYPNGITYNGSNWFIIGSQNDKVYKYDTGFNLLSSFSVVRPWSANPTPTGLTTNLSHLFVTWGDIANVSVFTMDGAYQKDYTIKNISNGISYYSNCSCFFAVVPGYILLYNQSFDLVKNYSEYGSRLSLVAQDVGYGNNELRTINWNSTININDIQNWTSPFTSNVTPPLPTSNITLIQSLNNGTKTCTYNTMCDIYTNKQPNVALTTSEDATCKFNFTISTAISAAFEQNGSGYNNLTTTCTPYPGINSTSSNCLQPVNLPDGNYRGYFACRFNTTNMTVASKMNVTLFTSTSTNLTFYLNGDTNIVNNLSIELGSGINLTVSYPSNDFCVDVNISTYGKNFTCTTGNTNFSFNPAFLSVNSFFNESNTTVWITNFTYNNAGRNHTLYIQSNQFFNTSSYSLYLKGFSDTGVFPQDVRVYINNTLSNYISEVLNSSTFSQTIFNNSNIEVNKSISGGAYNVIGYIKVPKTVTLENFSFNITGNISGVSTFYYRDNLTDRGTVNYTNLDWTTTSTQYKLNGKLDFDDAYDKALLSEADGSCYVTGGNLYCPSVANYAVIARKYTGTYNKMCQMQTVTSYAYLAMTAVQSSDNSQFDFRYFDSNVLFINAKSGSPNKYHTGSSNIWQSTVAHVGLFPSILSYTGGSSSVSYGHTATSVPYTFFPDRCEMTMNAISPYSVGAVSISKFYTNYDDTGSIISQHINYTGSVVAATLTKDDTVLASTSISYYLSADGGSHWESVTPGILHSFSYPGEDLRWKATMSTIDGSTTPLLNYVGINVSASYPSNVSIQIGTIDSDIEWKQSPDGIYNYTSNTRNNNSQFVDAANNFISATTQDSSGYVYIPINVYSSSDGNIKLKDLYLVYDYNYNPVELDTELINSYLKNKKNATTIPIRIESQTNGTIEVYNSDYRYRCGNASYTMVAHSYDYSTTATLNLTYYSSCYDFHYNNGETYIDFYPTSKTQKNVTPFGQDYRTAVMYVDWQNTGSTANLSVRKVDNATDCFNITISANSTKGAGKLLTDTYQDIDTNKPLLGNTSMWWWADLYCGSAPQLVIEPDIRFRACSNNATICYGD